METSNKTLDAIKSEGLAISQRELVNVFGPKASGNLSSAEIQKLYQDMPGALARNQERDEVFGTHEGLIARSGQFSEHQRKLLERLKEQGKAGGGIDVAFLLMIDDIKSTQQKIKENTDRLEKLDRYEEALTGVIESIENGGEVALNPDGSLQDADAEAAVKEFEENYGRSVDRTDPEALSEVLEFVRTEKRQTEVTLEELKEKENVSIENAKQLSGFDDRELKEFFEVKSYGEAEVVGTTLSLSEDEVIRTAVVSSGLDGEDQDFLLSFLDDPQKVEASPALGTSNPFAKGDARNEFSNVSDKKVDEGVAPKVSSENKIVIGPAQAQNN